MQKIRLAINGLGEVGRTLLRLILSDPATSIQVVAVNDPFCNAEVLPASLKYDSAYGIWKSPMGEEKYISMSGPVFREIAGFDKLLIGKVEIPFFQEKDWTRLPWGKLAIDIVVDATGAATTRDKLKAHLDAGAKRVVLTAPTEDDSIPMVTPNVNEHLLEVSHITSNASCTTNALAPLIAVLKQSVGIIRGFADTVHAYTANQRLVDGSGKKGDSRRGRAAAENIIPAETGAARAIGVMFKGLVGKFDGCAIRVPVLVGSYLILTIQSYARTNSDEVNEILREASEDKEWEGILGITYDQLVSRDIIGNPHGSFVDLPMTTVVDGHMVKVMSWYDNRWGYCSMLLKHIESVAKLLREGA